MRRVAPADQREALCRIEQAVDARIVELEEERLRLAELLFCVTFSVFFLGVGLLSDPRHLSATHLLIGDVNFARAPLAEIKPGP